MSPSLCPIMGLMWLNQQFLLMYTIWFEFQTKFEAITGTSEARKGRFEASVLLCLQLWAVSVRLVTFLLCGNTLRAD